MKPLNTFLDDLDLDIIARLRGDASLTNKAIAADLAVSESTISARIRSLSDRNVMRVVALHDVRSLGYDVLAHADISVGGAAAREVAEQFAARREFSMVALCAGTPQITVQINARDRGELFDALVAAGEIKGVCDIRTLVSVRIGKYISELSGSLKESPQHSEPDDELLERILRIVEHDGRIGNREIGRLLGISEATVRKRLKERLDSGAMAFGTMVDARALGLNSSAMIRLAVAPGQLREVGRALASMQDIHFVSVVAGEFDMLAVTTQPDREALTEFVNEKMSLFDGVTRVDVREISEVLKMQFNVVRLAPAGF